MKKNILKFIKINWVIFRNAIIRDSKIPGFILSSMAMQIFDVTVSIVFFNAVFANTKTIGGWDFYQVLFLFAFLKFVATIHTIWTKKGVKSLCQELIRLGDYDLYITKPYDPMVFVSISKPRLYYLVGLIFEAGLMYWAIAHGNFSISSASYFWFIYLTILGIFLYYFITIITVVPAFWVVKLSVLNDLMNRFIQFAKYPSGVFPPFLRVLLSTFIPILLVSYFPAKTLFYPPRISYIIYMTAVTIIFGIIARKFWRFGEKNYGSASS